MQDLRESDSGDFTLMYLLRRLGLVLQLCSIHET